MPVMGNPLQGEAVVRYLINFLTAKLPAEEAKGVSTGTFVEFKDCETGAKDSVCIDSAETGVLPRADGFFSAGDAEVAALMGALPGQEVTLPMAAGGELRVKVTASQTLLRLVGRGTDINSLQIGRHLGVQCPQIRLQRVVRRIAEDLG